MFFILLASYSKIENDLLCKTLSNYLHAVEEYNKLLNGKGD